MDCWSRDYAKNYQRSRTGLAQFVEQELKRSAPSVLKYFLDLKKSSRQTLNKRYPETGFSRADELG